MTGTMRSALRHLCQHGEQALRAQKVVAEATVSFHQYVSKPAREVWQRPKISKRVANDIRKQAIKSGTYGTFCDQTGVGWNPEWDLVLQQHRYQVTRFGRVRPSKNTARERNREDRAAKLEANLEGCQQAIEEHYAQKEESRVEDKSFEARMKRMARGGGPGGGPG
eukprot:CAMPEP_0168187940 /NCGR_PEP_ID=MMETSP0139_2-20121125/15331_1 /TAXON_ID=44445 /ORGANISM="Pseudo-nitzschia australis, Strain 10249 10 AB" /LENGTH=165 /DNA_ID=CAMNT_0008110243 /DNA_START=41 /DNA_END=538 /DNA_ORIENTATION=+